MSFVIQLAKQSFKFSATHFTLFSEERAEALHGHNYYVKVSVQFKSLDPDTGLAAEFSDLKMLIKKCCDQLDEKVLIPSQSPHLQIGEVDKNIELRFNHKFYSFPKEDCEVLPIVNTSSECLAQWVHQNLWPDFKKMGATALRVTLQETQGQGVSYSS